MKPKKYKPKYTLEYLRIAVADAAADFTQAKKDAWFRRNVCGVRCAERNLFAVVHAYECACGGEFEQQ